MPKNWTTAAPLYIEALSDIPPELLAVAVKQAIAGNPFFPKPADLRASISEELSEHRRRMDETHRAMLPRPAPTPKPTREDIAYVESLLAKTLGAVAAKGEALAGNRREAVPEYSPERMAADRAALGLE